MESERTLDDLEVRRQCRLEHFSPKHTPLRNDTSEQDDDNPVLVHNLHKALGHAVTRCTPDGSLEELVRGRVVQLDGTKTASVEQVTRGLSRRRLVRERSLGEEGIGLGV